MKISRKPCSTRSVRRPRAPMAALAAAFAAVLAGLVMAISVVPGAVRATPGETHAVTGEAVALRAAPGAAGKIVARLGTGDRVMELERRGGWVRGLLFGAVGKEGWVAVRYLRPEASATPVPAPGLLPALSPTPAPAPGVEAAAETPYEAGRAAAPTRLHFHCLDCVPLRRRDRVQPPDRPPPVVRTVPLRGKSGAEPGPVIRLVPKPAPVRDRVPPRHRQ